MNDPPILQYPTVLFHEPSRGESLVDFLHLRVGKGDPYFRHFIFSEEVIDQLDMRTQKSGVCQMLIQCFGSAFPHSRSLDVDTDKILPGKCAGQTYRILSFTASQLQHDGMIVPKKAVPFTF